MAMPSGTSARVPDDQDRAWLEKLPEIARKLRAGIAKRVLGQESTVEELLTAFIAGGNILVIGVPGLAKTLMISTMADLLDLKFSRIQFTPDLMPSDITGTSILTKNETSGAREFRFRPGPVFSHLLLADEINRTPPKTQAALLEAMEEKQVTALGETHARPDPFFVLATQNPLDQEGTYPLPVTQLDRFTFQIDLDYPDSDTEFDLIALTTARDEAEISPVLTHEEVLGLLRVTTCIEMPSNLLVKATQVVRATRPGEEGVTPTAMEMLSWGAGPRAIQAIVSTARASAAIAGRDVVTIEDVEKVIAPALRHRIGLNYYAEAERMNPDRLIRRIRSELGESLPEDDSEIDDQPGGFRKLVDRFSDTTPGFRTRPGGA